MDAVSYDELVTSHLSFAQGLARRFKREFQLDSIDLEDLTSAAYVGLCLSARRYKPENGSNFRTFSYMRVRGAMIDFLRRDSTPFSARRAVLEAKEVTAKAHSSQQSTIAVAEVPYASVRVLEELGLNLSIASPDAEFELSYLAPDCSPEEQSTAAALSRFMQQRLARLPEKERKVLLRKYYHDETFGDMATHFNDVRTSWLCRLHVRALDRLERQISAAEASEWLEQSAG